MFRRIPIRYAIIISLMVLMRPSLCESVKASSEDYAYKIAVETHLEQRLSAVLTEIAGSRHIIVIVNADVSTGKGSSGARSAVTTRRQKNTNALVLPGVPVKKEIGKGTVSEERAILSIPSVVRRLEVSILMDNDISESLNELVHDVAISVIGYNPDRGDRLTIKRIEFGNKGFKWASLFYPPHLYWVITIIVGGLFLISAAIFFKNPFSTLGDALRALKREPSHGGLPDSLEVTTRSLSQSPIAGGGEMVDGGQPLPFSFLEEQHIPDLAFLLAESPGEDIAIIVNYLNPVLSARLLESFPVETQAKVALLLRNTGEASAEKVKSIEDSVKSRLDYVLGGDNKVVSILNLTDSDTREDVLEVMEKEEAASTEHLRRKLKTFESIIRAMKPGGIQALFRQLDPTMFARILKSSSADLQKKVMESLSEGAVERLQEEIDLSPPFKAERLKKEKQNVVAIVLRMAGAGILEEDDY